MKPCGALLFVLLPVVAHGQTPSDERLAKPVTVKVKMGSLTEALKTLGAAGGVTLEPASSISGFKATILVKDQPLNVVMARLADVFHGEWIASGSGFRFAVPNEWLSRIASYRDIEDRERRRAAEAQIQTLVAGASHPFGQDKAATDAEAYVIGTMFRSMSGAQLQSFWNGQTFRYSMPLPNNAPLAEQSGGDQPQRGRNRSPRMRQVNVSAIYDPVTGQLDFGEAGRGRKLTRNGPLINHPTPTGPLADTPFGKEVLAWPKFDPSDEALAKSTGGNFPGGSYFEKSASIADQLAWIHEQTGIPIVADAFRIRANPKVTGGNAGALLRSIGTLNGASLRTENGFVMLRHGGFWRLRTFEVPEETYAKLESKTTPALDDYADFAARLTPIQRVPFQIPITALLKVDPEPLRVGMPALRFYGSLGAGQRRRALTGSAIAASEFPASSQALFWEALQDPYSGQSMGRGATGDPNRFGFLLSKGVVETHPGAAAPGYRFLFGTSERDGVVYNLALGG